VLPAAQEPSRTDTLLELSAIVVWDAIGETRHRFDRSTPLCGDLSSSGIATSVAGGLLLVLLVLPRTVLFILC
jgi:hypothetical protein